MKKLTLFILFLSFYGMNYAQSSYPFFYQNSVTKKKEVCKYKKNKVSAKIVFDSDLKKNDKTHIYLNTKYDSLGRQVSQIKYKNNGKVRWINKNEYLNDSSLKISSRISKKRNKITTWEQRKYINNDKLAEDIYKDKNGEVKRKTVYEYDDSLKLLKFSSYKKSGLQYYTLYSYYTDGAKKEVKRFKADGKLIKVYSYKCTDEGKNIKHKDTSNVCKIEDHSADGLKTISYLNTNEKGQITKSVYKYLNDTLLVNYAYYDKNDIIRIENKNIYENGILISSSVSYFNKKGEIDFKRITRYNNQNKIISSSSQYKDKNKLKQLYTYNKKDLIEKIEFYKNGVLQSQQDYYYSYY